MKSYRSIQRCAAFFMMACFTVGVMPAQPLTFERFTSNEGLYSITNDVLQDQRGFLWFATSPGGMRRYDGYAFEVYMKDPHDPGNSLWHNGVFTLAEDGTGHIWMGTRGSLDRYDPVTATFTHFLNGSTHVDSLSGTFVSALYVDADGQLWAGTDEGVLHHYDAASESFTRHHLAATPSEEPGTVAILAIHGDAAGNLWVGTDGNGLFHFEPATNTTTHYQHNPNRPASLGHNAVQALLLGPEGGLWIGTGGGLNYFDPGTEAFIRYQHEPGNPESLSHDDVRALAFDDDGRLWVGTYGGGLNRFDTESSSPGSGSTFTRYRHDASDPTSLVSDLIYKLYTDRGGIMWAATERGVSRFEPTGRSFAHYKADPNTPGGLEQNSVYGIYEARDGALWLGGRFGGLRRMDRATGAVTRYRYDPDDPSSIGGDHVEQVYEDREGMIWAASLRSGTRMLNRLDPQHGKVVRYPAIAGVAFYEDTEGALWVTAFNGLFRLNATTRAIDEWYGQGTGFADMLPDGPGGFWLGGEEGLYHFDRTSEAMEQVLEVDQVVINIHQRASEPGVLWLGTVAGGLLRFDTQTGQHTRLTTQNSDLPDNTVWGILEDEDGHLWLTMDFGGLVRFSPETGVFKPFDVDDGVQGREFNVFAAFQSTSGEFFVGGPNGINTFFPGEVTDNPYPPEVMLTQFALSDEPVPVGSALLPRALFATEQLTLAHDQDDVSFGYVGLHFSDPSRNRYAYMLEGYDEDWHDAGTQRTATYTNLSPGRYTFRVKAANSDGVWNEEGASVRLRVLPPWWRTTWAYLVYGLFFVGGVFAVDRVQRRRLIAREREKARERELEQAREIEQAHTELQRSHEHLKATQQQLVHSEKMASLGALTAGIAHEIKNPLNFVNNFAALSRELIVELREETDPEEIEAILTDLELNAEKIEEHGKRADGIVHSMMQHARGGDGQREAVDLNRFVDEYVDLAYHGKRAQVPDFNAEIARDYGDEVGSVEIVPQEIGRVLINLLSNAFDAVREQAHSVNGQYEPVVRVSTCKKENGVDIRVADNGPGIPEEVKAKIFEPFFTTKPTGSGTGLGLSMSYDIVTQGHGGTLSLESEDGQGAVFTVSLPAQSTTTQPAVSSS